MKELFSLEQMTHYLRERSCFFNHHLKLVPLQSPALNDIPLIDNSHYWHGSHDLAQWPVLTGPVDDAMFFKTGGTTSKGKLAVYTHGEWQALVQPFGKSLSCQLSNGDRVANLFFTGDLSAGFLFIHEALNHVDVSISEFPFTGNSDLQGLNTAIIEHRINVLAGIPAQLMKFAAHLATSGQVLRGVDTLLYGGESVFPGQLATFAKVFPNARVASIGYASVDAGLIGATSRDCELGEHRTFDDHTLLEIVDEQTGQVINECQRVGLLVVTNKSRRLMPILRYPVGDRACWLEPAGTPKRKFALRGRSALSQRVRVGMISLVIDEIHAIIQQMAGSEQWQLRIEQVEEIDHLSVNWVSEHEASTAAEISQALYQAFVAKHPFITLLTEDGQLIFQVKPCDVASISLHPRSGKQLRVLDLRVYSAAPELTA
ncbi:AMP-binding protein [Pseudomonas prosekii]|uniref:AMP-binding protein n=1 Tax=Pseudomonas prosekii TaxID=1148509 RepID=UPI003F750B8B